MSVKEIPRAFDYICDACNETHHQENAGGHYTNSRPPNWSHLKMAGAHDREVLLCPRCGDRAAKIVEAALDRNDSLWIGQKF